MRLNKPLLVLAVVLLSGCSHFVSNAASSFGDDLTGAVLNQDDPELVRDGMPSYILLLESLLRDGKDDAGLLLSASSLYASYGSVFAAEPERAMRLTARGRRYAEKAMCLRFAGACDWPGMPYDEFAASLAALGSRHADDLYDYGFALLAYIRAHSEDWNALAELPQASAVMERYIAMRGEGAEPSAHNYLGILKSLRPPALGGDQERARAHFETAIAKTDGGDLSPKLEMLKGIARMLYDRELNDRLCEEILDASPYADDYTLTNVLAQEEAAALCAESDDYF